MKIKQKPAERVWQDFQQECGLSDLQLAQFQRYEDLLSRRNQEFNLTAITDLSGIVRQHFVDSLALGKFIDMNQHKVIADIGSGAGFPGLPLKIMFPHLRVILIEVTKKKQQFLLEVIEQLGLTDVEIYDLDWRTFLRTTEYPVDMFVTRAAIDELELCKAFRPACVYNNALMVYWVTQQWEAHKKVIELDLVRATHDYKLGNKHRRLAVMGLKKESQGESL
ncbi:MAG: Ribosomal RNA small subunit methyltransferase G [candidate division TM6 bacterium GW2011_GWF2_38_10]|nr:MAG: Ribosomal RNA small subunit methyltransferase G [candidate division TM6 bacterium GW2011_GWF2_38_10]